MVQGELLQVHTELQVQVEVVLFVLQEQLTQAVEAVVILVLVVQV